jgi:hypothetical protein
MPYELHHRCHFRINRTTRRSAIRCSTNFSFKLAQRVCIADVGEIAEDTRIPEEIGSP